MDYKCSDSNSKESILLSPIRRQIIVIWCNADIETHRTESVGLELWRVSCNSLHPSQSHHSCLQPVGTKFSHHLAVIYPLSGLQGVFVQIQMNFKILTWIMIEKGRFVREAQALSQFSCLTSASWLWHIFWGRSVYFSAYRGKSRSPF